MPTEKDTMQEFLEKMFELMRDVKAEFGPEEHDAVEIFEDSPCYPRSGIPLSQGGTV